MLAISGFYKYFKNPIELQADNDAAPDNITPRNSPSANVYGVELEVRKDFGFISTAFANLSLNATVSVVNSVIEMRQNEYDSRQHFARDGEEVEDTRNLQGQSTYLITVGFNYHNKDLGLEAGLFYLVQGKNLDRQRVVEDKGG